MLKKGEQRILTREEREQFLPGVDAAVEEAFEILQKAGADAVVICAIKGTNMPRQPAVRTRMYRGPDCDLSPMEIARANIFALGDVAQGAPLPTEKPGEGPVN
jgi:hypothetical protein